jgi:hypothetical protein
VSESKRGYEGVTVTCASVAREIVHQIAGGGLSLSIYRILWVMPAFLSLIVLVVRLLWICLVVNVLDLQFVDWKAAAEATEGKWWAISQKRARRAAWGLLWLLIILAFALRRTYAYLLIGALAPATLAVIPVVLVHLALWGAPWVYQPLRGKYEPPLHTRVAWKRLRWAGGLLVFVTLFIVSLALGYSDPTITHVDIPVKGLAPEHDGLRVVVLSDVHVGGTDIEAADVEWMVKKTNAQNPDMVVMVGDITDGTPSELKGDMGAMADFETTFGTFFVAGNHEVGGYE